MQLSSNARKAVAVALTASTILWTAGMALTPIVASAAVHSDGCLVLSGGIVWMITGGTRRGFTSAEVFQSSGYNFSQVVAASTEDLALPVGPIMVYADGTLVKGPSDPLVYLVAAGQKRPFVSGAVFLGLGFSFANIQLAPANTFADLPVGANLDSTTIAHPAGVQVISNGAVWWMDANGRRGFTSAAQFNSYGYMFAHVVAANAADLALANIGDVPVRAACTGGGGTPPPSSGSMTVTLSSDNPVARSLVTTEAGADLAHFTFWGTATVTNVTLKRLGVSADASLLNVYLYDGQTRLTDAASVSSNSLITFNDPAGLFTISGSRTISVKADMGNGAAGETVAIQLVSALAGTVAFTGTPLTGSYFTTAAAALAAVTFGAVTPAANANLTPATDIVVWQSTGTVVTRDVYLSHFTIREVGGVPKTALTNLRLTVDGTQIGSAVAQPDVNGYSTFVPTTPYKLTTGSHTFKVTVDVVGGSSLSFTFSIRNKTDIGLTDSQYNVGLLTGTAIGALTGFLQTVSTGYVTVQKATASPSSTVVLNSTDAVLAKFTATTYGENVKTDTLLVDFTSPDATTVLRNGRVLIDGAQVGSTTNIDQTGTGTTYNINHTFIAGTTAVIEVRSDIAASAGTALANGDVLKVTLSTGVNNAQGVTSGDATLDVPTANVAANNLTVGVGSMVLTKDQAYGNQTAVVPSTATKLGSWTLTSGSNEAINLDTITVDFTTTDEFGPNNLTNVYVTYGAKTSSTKATITATTGGEDAGTSIGNAWSISEPLAANSNMTFNVYGNIATGAVVTETVADNVTPSLKVAGQTLSGSAVNTGTILAGQVTTAKTSGTLTVSLDNGTPLTAQAVAGSVSDGILKVKLHATNEDLYVKSVSLRVDATADDAALASVALFSAQSSGAFTQVSTSKTWNADGANPGYVTWTLTGTDRILVAKNGDTYLLAKPTYVSSGQGTVTNLTPQLFLSDLQAEGTSVLVAGGAGTDAINSTGIITQANSSSTFIDSTDTVNDATIATADTVFTVTNNVQFSPGDIIFVDLANDDNFFGAEELMVVLNDTTTTLTVQRGAFGTTPVVHATQSLLTGNKIFRLSGTVATFTYAGVIGNAARTVNDKLSLAVASDSPTGSNGGGNAMVVFKFVATAANNAADAASNKVVLTSVDLTTAKSGLTVNNVVVYPSTLDQNASYVTNCVALTANKWRCQMNTTGGTNEVVEGNSSTYTVRADVGSGAAAASLTVSIAALGSANKAGAMTAGDVAWTDGTTPMTWVDQASSVVQPASAITMAALSGTTDATLPTITTIVMGNDAVANQHFDIGGTILITFSERMDPTTISASLVPGAAAVAVVDGATGDIQALDGGDTIVIKNIITLAADATFVGATVDSVDTAAIDATGTQLTLTITTALNGTGADGVQAVTAGSAATTMKDVNGNAAAAAGSNAAVVTDLDL